MKSKKIFDDIIFDMYEYLEDSVPGGGQGFFKTLKDENPELLGHWDDREQRDYDIINKFIQYFVEHIQYSDPEFYTYYPR